MSVVFPSSQSAFAAPSHRTGGLVEGNHVIRSHRFVEDVFPVFKELGGGHQHDTAAYLWNTEIASAHSFEGCFVDVTGRATYCTI